MSVFSDNLWLSLPMPAFLIDPGDAISEVNPAGEGFLNTSARQIRGTPAFDTLAIDAPVDDQMRRARKDQASLVMNGVDVGGGNTAPIQCNVQLAPVMKMPGFVLMLIEPRVLADRADYACCAPDGRGPVVHFPLR